ncbi:MAG TPA: glycosyltransferase family 4 protein [Acidobacteriota bacterium]|nr:glycosyltransferase family 4 protein [Acidobacteriota bacterium]
MKPKLLIASDCFLPRWDGIARFLTDIIPHLKDEYEITVVAPDFAGEQTPINGIKIVRIPLLKNIKFGDYTPASFQSKTIEKLVLESDLVWIQTTASVGGLAANLAHKHKKPYGYYIHSIDWMLVSRSLSPNNVFRKLFYWFSKKHAREVYNNAKLLMVPSGEVLEILRWNKVTTPCAVVKLGIDIDRFVPAKDKKKAKAALSIDPQAYVVGYVNRISREKDILTLYRAFISFSRKYQNARLLVVGDGIASLKNELSKHPNIILVGAKDNVIPYMQAMDVFVLTSLLETTSLATLEAMSCAVPVICTPVGLVKEYVREKENGLLFPISNNLILSLKLEWLAKNVEAQERISKSARKTVIEEYSWASTVKHVKESLKTILYK